MQMRWLQATSHPGQECRNPQVADGRISTLLTKMLNKGTNLTHRSSLHGLVRIFCAQDCVIRPSNLRWSARTMPSTGMLVICPHPFLAPRVRGTWRPSPFHTHHGWSSNSTSLSIYPTMCRSITYASVPPMFGRSSSEITSGPA